MNQLTIDSVTGDLTEASCPALPCMCVQPEGLGYISKHFSSGTDRLQTLDEYTGPGRYPGTHNGCGETSWA